MVRRPSLRDASPLSDGAFADLMRPFAPFEARPVLAVAVSGGRDSRALALLARRWATRRGGRVVALIVDHGLRAESAAEATQTRRWLVAHAIEAHVLRWRPARHPDGGLQAAARAARYRLLLDWCDRHGVLHLLTAHQADDQAETYALRAARGSGPAGLAAMSAVVEFPEARLLRPLLPVGRTRLTATLEARGEAWIDDPSNIDLRFARARLRREGMPLTPAVAVERARRFARRRIAEERRIADALAGCAMPHPLGGALIDHSLWRRLPAALGASVLGALVAMVAGADYPPRRERTARVAAGMRSVSVKPDRPPASLALGGSLILWRSGGWLVVREPASIVAQKDGRSWGLWDGRFATGDRHRLAAHAIVTGRSPAGRRAWARAWPVTAGLPALLSALPGGIGGRALSPLAFEGASVAVHGAGDTGGKGASGRTVTTGSIRFRPHRPLAAGPFFPCFGLAKGQIVNN